MHLLFLFILSLFATANALAEPLSFSHLYVNGSGGVNIINMQKQENFSVHPGYFLGSAVGHAYSKFLRIEAEGTYRHNSFTTSSSYDVPIPNKSTSRHAPNKSTKKTVSAIATGKIRTLTAIANGIFQIPLLNNSLIPYCGAGLGERWTTGEVRVTSVDAVPIEHSPSYKLPLINPHGVYQLLLGFTFSGLGKNTYTTAEYRYLNGDSMLPNHAVGVNLKRCF